MSRNQRQNEFYLQDVRNPFAAENITTQQMSPNIFSSKEFDGTILQGC